MSITLTTPYNLSKYKKKHDDFFPNPLVGNGYRFAQTLIEIFREINLRHLDMTGVVCSKTPFHPYSESYSSPEPRKTDLLKWWPNDWLVGTDVNESTRWPHQIYHTYRLVVPVFWDLLVETLLKEGTPGQASGDYEVYHWVLDTAKPEWDDCKEYVTPGSLCGKATVLKTPPRPFVSNPPGDNPFELWGATLKVIRAILSCMTMFKTCVVQGAPGVNFSRCAVRFQPVARSTGAGFRNWVDVAAFKGWPYPNSLTKQEKFNLVEFKGFNPPYGSCETNLSPGVCSYYEDDSRPNYRTPKEGIGVGLQRGVQTDPPISTMNPCQSIYWSFCGSEEGVVEVDYKFYDSNCFFVDEEKAAEAWARLEKWLKDNSMKKPDTWPFFVEIGPGVYGGTPPGDVCSLQWGVKADLTVVAAPEINLVDVTPCSMGGVLAVPQLPRVNHRFPSDPMSGAVPNPSEGSKGWVRVEVPWGSTEFKIWIEYKAVVGSRLMLMDWMLTPTSAAERMYQLYGFEATIEAGAMAMGIRSFRPEELNLL